MKKPKVEKWKTITTKIVGLFDNFECTKARTIGSRDFFILSSDDCSSKFPAYSLALLRNGKSKDYDCIVRINGVIIDKVNVTSKEGLKSNTYHKLILIGTVA